MKYRHVFRLTSVTNEPPLVASNHRVASAAMSSLQHTGSSIKHSSWVQGRFVGTKSDIETKFTEMFFFCVHAVVGLPRSSRAFPEILCENRKHHQRNWQQSDRAPLSLTSVSSVLPSHPEFKAA